MSPPDRGSSLQQSNASADQEFGNDAADGTTKSCPTESTWIDIEMVDEDGKPIPRLRFQIFRPDGSLLGHGRLDDAGCGGFERIEDGDYEVCFPDLDEEAWKAL
ncbi:MAG: hypothetical protein AAF799_16240 [Myxococcota bacterium]